MASLAELVDIVIGVDTHKHTHTAAIVVAGTGGRLAELTVTTDPEGDSALVELADRHGGLRAWAIEGTGGYGAGLARGGRVGDRTGPPRPPGPPSPASSTDSSKPTHQPLDNP